MPRGRRHHARRRRSGRAQLLHPAGRRRWKSGWSITTCRASCREFERERCGASIRCICRTPDKVVTISHHLAHAYSAFAAVAVRRRRGDDRRRRRQLSLRRHGGLSASRHGDAARPRIRELLQVQRHEARMPEEGLDGAGPRLPQRRVLQHAGPRRALQPRLDLHLRRLEQMRRADGARALRPPRTGQAAARDRRRQAARAALDRRVQAALRRRRQRTGKAARRCGTGRIWPGGCRTTPRTCCSPAPAGCAKPPAPRISAWPAASR